MNLVSKCRADLASKKGTASWPTRIGFGPLVPSKERSNLEMAWMEKQGF
jgi:hypothetical protein